MGGDDGGSGGNGGDFAVRGHDGNRFIVAAIGYGARGSLGQRAGELQAFAYAQDGGFCVQRQLGGRVVHIDGELGGLAVVSGDRDLCLAPAHALDDAVGDGDIFLVGGFQGVAARAILSLRAEGDFRHGDLLAHADGEGAAGDADAGGRGLNAYGYAHAYTVVGGGGDHGFTQGHGPRLTGDGIDGENLGMIAFEADRTRAALIQGDGQHPRFVQTQRERIRAEGYGLGCVQNGEGSAGLLAVVG